MAPLAIDVIDLQGVANKIATIIGKDLPSRGQSVLGTEWVHIALALELDGLGPRSLDVPHEQRIGSLIDVLAAVRDGLDVGAEGEIGGGGALGDEHLGRSACDVMLEEGRLAVEGLLLRVEILLG